MQRRAHTLLEGKLLGIHESDLGLACLALHHGLALHGRRLVHAVLQSLNLLRAALCNCKITLARFISQL